MPTDESVEIKVSEERDGIRVDAMWWAEPGAQFSAGPRRLTITVTDDASPQSIARGVTSGVMRRAEQLLGEINERHGSPAARREPRIYWDKVTEWARSLPPSPRSDADYYPRLLDLFEFLEATQAQPVNDLLCVMHECGRPMTKSALNKQLQRARLRRAGEED